MGAAVTGGLDGWICRGEPIPENPRFGFGMFWQFPVAMTMVARQLAANGHFARSYTQLVKLTS